MHIYSETSAGILNIISKEAVSDFHILAQDNTEISCPVLSCTPSEDSFRIRLDASGLKMWSPDTPVLYRLVCGDEDITFGYTSLRTFQNKAVLLNDSPIYLRGYIRGIIAHDHPNMTGKSDYEAACKNIRQAKKYGFNLVRFHSTIPSEDFVRAADELGLLIHLEVGFEFERDDDGNKTGLAVSNERWVETLVKYRSHPSVAVFCIGNELHKSGHEPVAASLYHLAKKMAPGKLIVDNSGWGEYDRTTADIYSQHIAYFFPKGVHRDMFLRQDAWYMDGSVHDVPFDGSAENAEFHREVTPLRPVISHEAMHYIDIPDYDALNRKFDEFAERVGPEYLEKHQIKKPRYLTELPRLIREKGLTDRMPDYIAGSRQWRLMAVKTFLERLRFSPLCGYEMLQLSDCLKYENKNGILDFFDDDRYFSPEWMRSMNSDITLLAEFPSETFFSGAPAEADVFISDFLPAPEISGELTVSLDDRELYHGEHFYLAGGLQKLVHLNFTSEAAEQPVMKTLRAEFRGDGISIENSWKLWFYPEESFRRSPAVSVQNPELAEFFSGKPQDDSICVTDSLNEDTLNALAQNKTVVLLYQYGAERNKWQLPGAKELFKPCIWDRGSNLGGILYNEPLRKALGSGRYFDLHFSDLLDSASKINLDNVPFRVSEHISGIDKPVRDRMKGLIHHIKDFIPEDTLRCFSHLFSVRVGGGLLVVCTLNTEKFRSPAVSALLHFLINQTELLDTDCIVTPDELKNWLEDINARPFRPEDTMNHFWEIDNKLVEDKLFWEEANIDLRKL